MIGGEQKLNILKESKGLIFPVIWNEPFGLAITESLYCGAPVFGTPYGSLPELIT
ncbi:MAG: glycosyltransferase, partial [Bacteroidales bacterium]